MATDFEECSCIDFREYEADPDCPTCGGTGSTIPNKIVRVQTISRPTFHWVDGHYEVTVCVDADWDVCMLVMSETVAIRLAQLLLGVA
jgi:hypothetical protein